MKNVSEIKFGWCLTFDAVYSRPHHASSSSSRSFYPAQQIDGCQPRQRYKSCMYIQCYRAYVEYRRLKMSRDMRKLVSYLYEKGAEYHITHTLIPISTFEFFAFGHNVYNVQESIVSARIVAICTRLGSFIYHMDRYSTKKHFLLCVW